MSASEVVDLRIGSHPDFTRVVFELDTPAGYRIERASTSDDTWELVVSIDATSIPRKVQSSKSLIGLVRITPKADRSVAHIELRKEGLSLKEMILANPPRIVLDILAPAEQVATPTKTAAKPSPKKPAQVAAAKPEPRPAPTPVAAKAEPKPAAKPAPIPERMPAPKATETAKAPAPKTAAAPEASKPEAKPSEEASPPPVLARTKPSGGTAAGEPSEGGIPTMGMAKPAPKPAARPAASKPAPKKSSSAVAQARLAEEPDSGGSSTLIMAGAAVVALVFFALFMLRRRKSGAANEEAEDTVEAPEFGAAAGGDANPFADMVADEDDQPVLGITQSTTGPETAPAAFEADTDIVELGGMEEDSDTAEVKEDAPVDTLIGGEQSMEVQDTAIIGGAERAPVIGSAATQGGSDDVMRMMREFERRIASLETRLDESADARERLERQVAAQTEELRVQRAAIARTQRAVRNLNRSDDEGPTEPALRDPQ